MSGKSLLAIVIACAGLLMVTTAGTAHAAGDLYAAIAVGHDHVGDANNYPTQFAAEQAALRACEHGVMNSCTVKADVHNACGAVVERDVRTWAGSGPEYYVGVGYTAATAQGDARLRAALRPALAVTTKQPFVLDTVCTSNAR